MTFIERKINRRGLIVGALTLASAEVLAACTPAAPTTQTPTGLEKVRTAQAGRTATPEAVGAGPEKEVTRVVTQVVEKEVTRIVEKPVEKIVTQVVEKEKVVEKVVTATRGPEAQPVPGCPPAEQLGPWAPSASGEGETFEFTNHRGSLHMSLWWPHGKTPWGQKEVSVAIEERGTSYEAVNAAGTGWDYPSECPTEEFKKQVEKYRTERPPYSDFHGAVELKQLLDLGLVRNRLPRRGPASTGTPSPTVVAKPTELKPTVTPTAKAVEAAAGCVTVAEAKSNPGDWEVDAKDGHSVVSLWWDGYDSVDGGKEVRVFVPQGQKETFVNGRGTRWNYTAGCSPEFVQKDMEASAQKAGFRVATLDELKKAGLVR